MNTFSNIITRSSNFESIINNAKLVAGSDASVLLKGRTGTGKEVFAHAIHHASKRADKVFLKLNCAAFPAQLIESKLFGYQKGAFTGAKCHQDGLLKAADGGTLFLDEIDSLQKSTQRKLLHFLDSKELIPLGASDFLNVNVRIIAATNVDLVTLVDNGMFHSDLYFRLNVFPVELPNLIDRDEDIEPLIHHFFNLFEKSHGISPPIISKNSLKILKNYKWPGNIRELKNTCEYLSVLFSGKILEPQDLPDNFKINIRETIKAKDESPEIELNLDVIQMKLICQALDRTDGNYAQSARLLGISRDALIYRAQKYGLTNTMQKRMVV